MSKQIVWTLHALTKFETFKKSGFPIAKKQVLECLRRPDRIDLVPDGVRIAQKVFDHRHVLRVVHKWEGDAVKIITFHPGERRRYEGEKA